MIQDKNVIWLWQSIQQPSKLTVLDKEPSQDEIKFRKEFLKENYQDPFRVFEIDPNDKDIA
jgi:hypothetical protein